MKCIDTIDGLWNVIRENTSMEHSKETTFETLIQTWLMTNL